MKRLTQYDPWELREMGWKIIDSGYAENKEIFEKFKERYIHRYPNCKVYRAKSDTKGLLAYDVYVKED